MANGEETVDVLVCSLRGKIQPLSGEKLSFLAGNLFLQFK